MDAAYRKHERRWKDHRYVYAVVSRRSRGISVGINLNPGRECNFYCVYCQVDRQFPAVRRTVNLDRLRAELDSMIQDEKSGLLYDIHPFSLLSRSERGIRDIAFSGDGEPTASPVFSAAVEIVVRARRRFELINSKIVLITNASRLDQPEVCEALDVLYENNGEVWAKLDAGTEEYFQKINRAKLPLEKILENILMTSRIRPLIVQSLWMRQDGAVPPSSEIEAYCGRLNALISSGGQIKGLQIYTIARSPADPSVSALADEELDRIAATVRSRVTVPLDVFYGV